jgi:hypothetical protein
MSTIINASTSSGLVQTADTSGTLELQSNGTTQLTVSSTGAYGQLKSGTAQASTSVTSIDFTGIPSWVKRITVMLYGVSTSSTNPARAQLGTGGTPTYIASGYAASAAALGSANTTAITAFTDGFPFSRTSVAADTVSSIMTLVKITGNIWEASANTRTSGNTVFSVVSGQVDAGAEVTALRITINGTDTFDAGSINILYEG